VGRFQNLSQVSLVLADVIEASVATGTEVRINVPLEDPASAAPAIRITLLWTTPQTTHRNDSPERNPDGTLAPPPPTLSAWYVISTYGATDEQNAIRLWRCPVGAAPVGVEGTEQPALLDHVPNALDTARCALPLDEEHRVVLVANPDISPRGGSAQR
jgi:hypothetical protein